MNNKQDKEPQASACAERGVAQLVSTWRTKIGAILHHLIVKLCPGFFERGAARLATDHDEQIRISHVLKNMGHSADWAILLGN